MQLLAFLGVQAFEQFDDPALVLRGHALEGAPAAFTGQALSVSGGEVMN